VSQRPFQSGMLESARSLVTDSNFFDFSGPQFPYCNTGMINLSHRLVMTINKNIISTVLRVAPV
jgi:hypothetical protein